MKIDTKSSTQHFWLTTFWCSLGLIALGALAVISFWIKRCRSNVKYQYSAILDSGVGATDRNPKERACRDRAFTACADWLISTGGRYEIIVHLDDIGSRSYKHWFLLNDCAIKTDRLMSLLPLPQNCVALEELPSSECPQGILMELLGSLQHPYIYPILDLGFFHTETHHYACLVMPFNPRGSLKDLLYKSQWNEPWGRKYTRKSTCLPISQVQRLGRQILEALLFLRERGISSHGHLHSGNVIIQNGVARLSGLENGLLGLNSRVNSVLWSRSSTDIESVDVICFGHLLFEMCTGYELSAPTPSRNHLQLDLEHCPQVAEVIQMIFESPSGYPTLEELVLCDLFRNIDLREMRGSCVNSFKPNLSHSTMSLLNAVRKRHSVMQGSFSEGSSPCTPPSTPRDRHGPIDDVDDGLSESESEPNLDEIIVATIDTQISPIHYCDANGATSNQLTADDKGTVIRISSFDEASSSLNVLQKQFSHSQTSQQSLDPSSAYKNSKTRRTEYSMRNIKLGCSNPSQDSAFGSMTDGELSRASSFKLSSFQSVSSPIDEGVEDILEDKNNGSSLSTVASSLKFIDSNSSSPCYGDNFTQSLNDLNIPGSSLNASSVHVTNIKETCIFLDPPKLIVNDHSSGNFIYTSSPIRKCTTAVFSQKYRVSSFEDMAHSIHHLRNQVCKKQFRSFEEEQRIESAFTPISHSNDMLDASRKSSPIKYLTAPLTGKERSILWKDSFMKCNKNNLTIKSNESIYDVDAEEQKSTGHNSACVKDDMADDDDDDDLGMSRADSSVNVTPERLSTQSSRRMRSDRFSFSLAKFKQTAILDNIALDTLSESSRPKNKQLSNSSSSNDESNIDTTTITTTTTNDDCISEEECSSLTESLLKTPSHDDVRKFIRAFDSEENSSSTGHGEEKTPLLDSMEFRELSSMSSSTEPE